MEQIVYNLTSEFKKKTHETIGYIDCDIDCRKDIIRLQETNCANFIADIVRRAYKTDCVIFNSGAMRSNAILKKGKFTYGDILNMFPLNKPMNVLKVTGKDIYNALEVGLKKLPIKFGGFPAISGLNVLYNSKNEPFKRVIHVAITKYENSNKNINFNDAIKNEAGKWKCRQFYEVLPNKIYTLATREYLAKGGDGYQCFKNAQMIIDDEIGLNMPIILRNFFWSVTSVNALHKIKEKRNKTNKIMKIYSIDAVNDGVFEVNKQDEKDENESKEIDQDKFLKISPKIDGRLVDEATIDKVFDNEEFPPKEIHYETMPEFVNLKKMPRQESLIKQLSDCQND